MTGDVPAAVLTARSTTVTVVAQVAARGISLALIIVSTAIVARTLAVGDYADWVTILSLVALSGVLLDPSVSPVVVRRLAQDPEAVPTPRGMIALRLALGLAALALVTAVTVALRGSDALVLALALGSQVVPRALVLNATPWLQTDHRLHRQTALEAVCAGLGLAALATAAVLDADPAVLALAGFTIPTSVLAVLVTRELHRAPSSRVPTPERQREKVRAVLREAAPLAVAVVLAALYLRLNTVFVNVAEESEVVAQYLFSFQFVEQILVVSGILAGALLPILARRARSASLLQDAATGEMVLLGAAAGALGAAALIAFAPLLVRVIGGDNLVGAERYLELLAPMSAVLVPAMLMGAVYLAAGRGARYLWFSLAALVFNLVANAALTLSFGAVATARVTWLTELVVIGCAVAPLVRAGGAGRAAVAEAAVVFGLCIVAAELAGNDVLPAGAAGGLLALAVLGLTGRGLLRLVAAISGGRPAPTPAALP